MFQFRFVLLALMIPLAGVAALLGGTVTTYNLVMPPYESVSGSAAAAGVGTVAAFASQSVDAAAVASADPDIAAAVEKGALTPKAEAALLGKAGGYGAPSFGVIIGVDGSIKAKSGADPKLPDNIAGMPVVAEALRGIARDTLWSAADGTPTHLAASPVYTAEGNLAGAIMLGWPYTAELVASFARATQVTTFVVVGNKVIGNLPAGVEASSVAGRSPFGDPTPTAGPLPILVPDRVRFGVSSLPLYPGDAGASLVTLVDRDPAFAGIASLQVCILGATAVFLLLVLGIIASSLRAINRPIELITAHLSLVQQQGAGVGILPEAGLGPMLRLGKQINMLLQNLPSATRPSSGTFPLFGGAPSSTSQDTPMVSSPPAAMFDPPPSNPAPAPTPSIAPMNPVVPPATSAAPAISQPPANSPPAGGLAGLFDEGPDPLAPFRVPPTQSTPSVQPKPPPPPPEPEPELPAMQPEATVMFQVPQSLLAASATPAAPSPPPPSAVQQVARSSDDDNRTVVAQVPQELLARVAPKNDIDAADEAHYKEVYEKFVQTRIECGEDTSDLSYDRFVAKLIKNRQQIVEKHKAKSVRFQVYSKDGKAALRALPVRD